MSNNKYNLPQHIGIIMDGNRRWAKEHHLSTIVGHKQGYNTLVKIADYCLKRGIKMLTVYAFSTENWKRSKHEVKFLLGLLKWALRNEIKDLNKKNIKIQVLGKIDKFSKDIQALIREAIETTKHNTRGVLNLALNYGGRAEIVEATRKIVKLYNKVSPLKIDENLISKYLYTNGEPDPDLIIRTSGELRMSNFLLWQGAYSELYFTDKKWPEFTEKDFDKAIEEYNRRKRRFGK